MTSSQHETEGSKRWNQSTRCLARKLSDLVRDRRGASFVLLAIVLIPLIGFLGLAIDLGRGYLVKSQLSHALDAAGLAGGRVVFSDTLSDDIHMFFDANMPPGFMNTTIEGPFFEVSEDNEVISLNATAVVNTTFMRVLGIDTMNVSAFSEITRQTELLDLVLAVDMSTSMTWDDGTGGGTSRIEAARAAAVTLVDILFGDHEEKELLNMAVVPWAGKVNVTRSGETFTGSTSATVPSFTNPITGADQSQVFYANNSPVPLLSAPASNWKGCVAARYSDDGTDDNDADLYYGPITRNGSDWHAWESIGPAGEPVPGGAVCTLHVSGDSKDCRACVQQGITVLDNHKQTILDAVNGLTSPVGTTNIIGGLFWAWHVLKPEAPFTEANPDPDFPRQQAIILLTDGEHQGGSGDAYNAVFGLGTSAGAGGMDVRLTELATRIKAEGVIIYVVQFRYNTGDLATLLKGAASGPDAPFYNFAPDGDALTEIFQEVANHLSELRLSK